MNRKKLLQRLARGALKKVAFRDMVSLIQGFGFRSVRQPMSDDEATSVDASPRAWGCSGRGTRTARRQPSTAGTARRVRRPTRSALRLLKSHALLDLVKPAFDDPAVRIRFEHLWGRHRRVGRVEELDLSGVIPFPSRRAPGGDHEDGALPEHRPRRRSG